MNDIPKEALDKARLLLLSQERIQNLGFLFGGTEPDDPDVARAMKVLKAGEATKV
jgi:hypothetical protein